MITGFARIIIYNKYSGMISFQEGHFTKGVQDGFGRFMVQDENNEHEIKTYMFVGWIPDSSHTGLGFSMSQW